MEIVNPWDNCFLFLCNYVIILVDVNVTSHIPILFLVYINDLPLSLSNSIADIFADDTTLSVHSKSFDEGVKTLSYDWSQVDTWCKQNHKSINSTKSKVIFIISKGNSSRVVNAQPPIHLNDSFIETCSSA